MDASSYAHARRPSRRPPTNDLNGHTRNTARCRSWRRRTPGCSTVRDRRVRVRGRRSGRSSRSTRTVRGDGGGDDDDEVDASSENVRRAFIFCIPALSYDWFRFRKSSAPPSRPGRGPAAMEKGRRARRWSPRRRSSPRRRAIRRIFSATWTRIVAESRGRWFCVASNPRRGTCVLRPSFSAPDTTSTLMSLSPNTSMGVCAFHAGSLNTVPVASPYADADEPHDDTPTPAPESRRSRPGDDANHASAAPAEADVAFFHRIQPKTRRFRRVRMIGAPSLGCAILLLTTGVDTAPCRARLRCLRCDWEETPARSCARRRARSRSPSAPCTSAARCSAAPPGGSPAAPS